MGALSLSPIFTSVMFYCIVQNLATTTKNVMVQKASAGITEHLSYSIFTKMSLAFHHTAWYWLLI